MIVGVISDTHDQYENIRKVVNILNGKGVELTIHCGDWVSPFSLEWYKDLKSPIKGVFGNNDGDRFLLGQKVKDLGLDIEYRERVLKIQLDKRIIYAYHGDYEDVTDSLVKCGQYDAVFHGHTHIMVNKTLGKTLSLNPGTLIPVTRNGVKGASFAVYNTTSNTAEIIKL